MTKTIKHRMYRNIAVLIFLILTVITATFATKIKTKILPKDEAGESKTEAPVRNL
jgi:hypothetical protein